jgi:hypothetical protein
MQTMISNVENEILILTFNAIVRLGRNGSSALQTFEINILSTGNL